jgi:hypothetical protein
VGLITGHRAKELIAHYSHRPHSSVARTAEALEQMDKKLPKKNPARRIRPGKNNPALSIVGADLCVCPGATPHAESGADTQVCPYDKHRRIFVPVLKSLIILGQNWDIYAEGGTRTRTAFWARGFSYHYSFRHLPSFWSPFGFDSLWSGRCLLRACFFACFVEQVNKPCLGGSRLVSTLC